MCGICGFTGEISGVPVTNIQDYDIVFTQNNTSVTIKKYKGTDSCITIPETISGAAVKQIAATLDKTDILDWQERLTSKLLLKHTYPHVDTLHVAMECKGFQFVCALFLPSAEKVYPVVLVSFLVFQYLIVDNVERPDFENFPWVVFYSVHCPLQFTPGRKLFKFHFFALFYKATVAVGMGEDSEITCP